MNLKLRPKFRMPLPLAAAILLQAQPALAEKEYLLINGGCQPSINYDIHEEDLAAFDRNLFNGKAIILNADGPDAKVIQIDYRKGILTDAKGGYITRPTLFPAGQAATLQNLRAQFTKFSASPPSDLSIIYGDHGSPNGVALWNGDRLDVNEIRSLQSKLPESTVIRSLHLHCYAGAVIADPARKPPDPATSPNPSDAMARYLDQEFPKNRCSVGLSNEKELGQYISWGLHGDQNPWNAILRNKPDLSLDDTKNLVGSDARYNVSPMLTSDYLVQDLATFFCADLKREEGANGCNCTLAYSHPAENRILERPMKKFCGGPAQGDFDRVNADVSVSEKMETEMEELKGDWIADRFFDDDKDAEIYISFGAAKGRVDELRAKFAAKAAGAPTTKDELNAKIDQLWGQWYDLFYERYYHFSNNDAGFLKQLSSLTPEWFQGKKDKYPTLAENAAWLFAQAAKNRISLKDMVSRGREDAQRKRKEAWIKFSNERRNAVESELPLRDPRLKARYENIRSCEKSSLR